MCSTQRNNENGLSVIQKETAKWSVHFETMANHYRDLLWQSQKKSGTFPTREWTEKSEQSRKWKKVWQYNKNKRMGNEMDCALAKNRLFV